MALFEKAMAASLTLEGVAAKFSFFYEQTHLLHWQTTSYAEHVALGSFYDKLVDFKDEIVEKLMGYTGTRVKAFKIESISDTMDCKRLVADVATFAKQIEEWAEEHEYCDIENIAQSLSGEAAKTLYLLTLS